MNTARLAAKQQGLRGVEKKVFEAVPISELWLTAQIAAEVERVHGTRPEHSAVNGILDHLKTQGLVREPRHGHFQRVTSRKSPTLKSIASWPDDKPPNSSSEKQEDQPPLSETDELLSIAVDLRKLGDRAKKLAEQIDDAVLDLVAKDERSEAELKKLRQLQQILKNL